MNLALHAIAMNLSRHDTVTVTIITTTIKIAITIAH
jgi:hypothetical protein